MSNASRPEEHAARAARADLAAPDPHGPRTHTCGELREDDAGAEVILKGWVDTRRSFGGMIFIDLRDRYGLTQIVFAPQTGEAAYETAGTLKREDVISIEGIVQQRREVNPELKTGDVEVHAEALAVLSIAETPPFVTSAHEKREDSATEALRLKHRYLDLRRPELQKNLALRHRFYQATRRYYDARGFLEIETPVLMKSTPEGARDFLVPSRLHPGRFYALPQSPQTYKQILMIAGLDRYVQIVKCFRDEDLRADRQPEFTQVDVEMSFATEEQVYDLIEGHMAAVWQAVKGTEIETPFPRMSYDEALRTYGTDKPDLRFGLKIHDVSEVFDGSGVRFLQGVLDGGGRTTALRVPGEAGRSRSALDRLEAFARDLGAGGLGHLKVTEGGVESWLKPSILDPSYAEAVAEQAGAGAGDLVLILAGAQPDVFHWMGRLRLHLSDAMNLIPPPGEAPWRFLWVTDFPLLEWNAQEDRHGAMHHPFTAPQPDDLERLDEGNPSFDPASVRARAYDLVLNGHEVGGGSIRIHDRAVQQRVFRLLGLGEEEAQRRFGFLLDAFRYGAPPHGGIALGLDRLVMLLAGASSLREVIAFPKTQSAQEPMVSSPDVVDEEQLRALHLRLDLPEE